MRAIRSKSIPEDSRQDLESDLDCTEGAADPARPSQMLELEMLQSTPLASAIYADNSATTAVAKQQDPRRTPSASKGSAAVNAAILMLEPGDATLPLQS